MEIQTFDDLRKKIGAILGTSIPPKSFEAVCKTVDARGGLGNKQIISILVAMYTFLETNTDGKLQAGKTVQPTTA